MRAAPCPSYATQHVKLTIATADTGCLIWAALWGPKAIYRPGFRYKKTGVLFLDLAPAASVQGSMFIRPDTPERVRLMELVNEINRRHGCDRVRFACSGMERGWKLKAELLSQRHTMRWGKLLCV